MLRADACWVVVALPPREAGIARKPSDFGVPCGPAAREERIMLRVRERKRKDILAETGIRWTCADS